MSQVVVVIGGGPLSPRAISDVAHDATIIAADSGLDHAVAAGLRPTVLIGDLDSISAHGKMWAYAHEVEIDQHPVDKASPTPSWRWSGRPSTGATDLLVFGAVGRPVRPRPRHARRAGQSRCSPGSRRFACCSTRPSSTSSIPAGRSTIDLPLDTSFSLLALHGAVQRRRRDRGTLAAGRRHARALEHPRHQQRDNRASTRRRRRRHSHSGGPMKRLLSPSCVSPPSPSAVGRTPRRRASQPPSPWLPTTRSRPRNLAQRRARRVHQVHRHRREDRHRRRRRHDGHQGQADRRQPRRRRDVGRRQHAAVGGARRQGVRQVRAERLGVPSPPTSPRWCPATS